MNIPVKNYFDKDVKCLTLSVPSLLKSNKKESQQYYRALIKNKIEMLELYLYDSGVSELAEFFEDHKHSYGLFPKYFRPIIQKGREIHKTTEYLQAYLFKSPLMHKVRYLDLRGQVIINLDYVARLIELEGLNIAWTEANSAKGFEKLQNLKWLSSGNVFLNYSFIKELKNLETLRLTGIGLKDSEYISESKSIQNIYFHSDAMISIAPIIETLAQSSSIKYIIISTEKDQHLGSGMYFRMFKEVMLNVNKNIKVSMKINQDKNKNLVEFAQELPNLEII